MELIARGSRQDAGSSAGSSRVEAVSPKPYSLKPTPYSLQPMTADKPFGIYSQMEKQTVREADVKENNVLTQLKDLWKRSRYFDEENCDTWQYLSSLPWYLHLVQFLRFRLEIKYSAEDIENFSITLAEFQDERNFAKKAGCFLAALIIASTENTFRIQIRHLAKKIVFPVFRVDRKIAIKLDGPIEEEFFRAMGVVCAHCDVGCISKGDCKREHLKPCIVS